MNRLAAKYKDKLTFLFIYAQEAHPRSETALSRLAEDIDTVTPQKAEEVYAARQNAGRSLRTQLAQNWHVLIDSYGQLGARPSYMCVLDNPLFVADKDGKIVKCMEWTHATELEQFLDTLLGDQTPP